MVPSHFENPQCPPPDVLTGLDDRHRLILGCLSRLTPPVELTELATRTFVSDARAHPERGRFEPALARERARLHRVDLPHLERRGLLTYDRDRRVITSFAGPHCVLGPGGGGMGSR